jgi:pyroglutamyl-peptidase
MNKSILLTSFQPWLAHHRSNSSDDLLERLELTIPNRELNGYRLDCLRQLPVDGLLASQRVIDRLQISRPQIAICCGMAESYQHLTIEQQATQGEMCLNTNVDLDRARSGLQSTEIGYDAGKFVCEHLYFNVLNHINTHHLAHGCIFVHVPLLKDSNSQQIFSDFCRMLTNLTLMYDRDIAKTY